MLKTGVFLPITLAVAAVLAWWLRTDIERLSSSTPVRILLAVGFLVSFLAAAYILNLVAIIVFRRSRLDAAVSTVWQGRLKATLDEARFQDTSEGPLGCAARLCIWFGRPQIAGAVVSELFAAERALGQKHATRCGELAQEKADVVRANANLETQIQLADRQTLSGLLKTAADRWRRANVPPKCDPVSIDDPVYGRISLDERIATVLAHPIVQRLNRIRQLSFSYCRFPSATHSRLSHSLGVAKNAEIAVTGILDRAVCYVAGESTPRPLDREILETRSAIVRDAKLLGLLHDVGHAPFGHALETYLCFHKIGEPEKSPDKRYSAAYVRDILGPTLSSLGLDANRFVHMLCRLKVDLNGIDQLLADIIDSSLDVDRMDYLVRDAHMTGLQMGFTNTLALLDSMRPVLDNGALILAYDSAAVEYMEHFLYARAAMYSMCYETPRKRAAERLFTKLVKCLVDSGIVEVDDLAILTDEEILAFVRSSTSPADLPSAIVEELVGNQNYVVCHKLDLGSPHATKTVQLANSTIMQGTAGDLRLVYIVLPELWEQQIAASSVGDDRQFLIQVLVPSFHLWLQHHSEALILTREGDGPYRTVNFLDHSRVMRPVLEAMEPLRNQIRVMCPSRFTAAERQHVRAAAQAVLGT